MKKIIVPLLLQKQDSSDCGPVCVQMILKYFGIDVVLRDLSKQLSYSETGTSIYDNGILLLKNNLKATAVTAQPLLFSPDIQKKLVSKKKIITYLDSIAKKSKKFKKGIKIFVTFLQKGGELKIKIPSFKDIQQAIDQNKLVLVLMNAQSLGSKEGGYHFIIVSGYKNNQVYITNPLAESVKKGWFPVDNFLYGVHASTCADIDNGTFLIVDKNH